MKNLHAIACTLLACISFVTAWQWVVVLEPSSPVVPLALLVVAGFALRHAFTDLQRG